MPVPIPLGLNIDALLVHWKGGGFSYLVPDNTANCGKKSVLAQIPSRQSLVESVLVQRVSDVFHCL